MTAARSPQSSTPDLDGRAIASHGAQLMDHDRRLGGLESDVSELRTTLGEQTVTLARIEGKLDARSTVRGHRVTAVVAVLGAVATVAAAAISAGWGRSETAAQARQAATVTAEQVALRQSQDQAELARKAAQEGAREVLRALEEQRSQTARK